jgi:hypothetical protein
VTAGLPGARRWPIVLLVLLGVPQLLLVNFWPLFPSPNERARVYQALAVVDRGSLAIDDELAAHGGHEDVAVVGGRRFPNKAPGTLPLLLPGAAVARLIGAGEPAVELRWALYLGRLLAASVPALIAVALLARRLEVEFPLGGPAAVAVFAVATPMLAASLLAFSHALTACLLLAGWLLLEGRRPSPWQALAAGLVLAWAATAEYPTAVPAAVIVALAARRLGWRGLATLAAGALPPLALLAAYDAACFGSPWTLSSAVEANAGFAGLASRGLFGIGWPSLSGLATLLLSLDRGLLVWAPVLVLALVAPFGRRRERGVGALAPAVARVLVMSGYPNAHGGWFPGPRYLLPVLPLLVVPLAAGLERASSRRWARVAVSAAALWGWLQAWLSVLSFPFPPEGFALPAFSFALPLAAAGAAFPSWLPPVTTLAVTVSAALAAAVLLVLLLHPPGRRHEAGVAVALVAAVALAAARVERPATYTAWLQWAMVRDALEVGDGRALEAVRLEAATVGERAAAERLIGARDDARRRNR